MSQLVEYGIQNEQSDLRVHVCPVVKRVYVYSTASGQAVIRNHSHPQVNGFQPGVDFATARGYLVPPFDIPKCVSLAINPLAWPSLNFQKTDSTSAKGKKATRLVVEMIRGGLLPIPALCEEVAEYDIQVKGQDIIIRGGAITKEDIRIQVKCDYEGGERELGGTGNLFLQTHECNPLKHY